MEKGVSYVRVSSKEQKEEGFSPDAQKKLLQSYSQEKNIRIIRPFEDVETAKKAGREDFGKMVEFLASHPDVKHILVEKTDRLYRNFRDYVIIDDLNIVIHLIKENEVLSKESKSHQKFIHGIKVLMAKNYIDNLSEETKKGMLEKAEQGYYPSTAPLGYRNIKIKQGERDISIIEKDEQIAPIVQKLFRLYSTGDYSLKALTKVAQEEGLRNKWGAKKVYKSTVYQMLKNPIYYGDFLWCGKTYQGNHPSLVTKELFKMVQDVFENQNRPKQSKRNFPYTGLMVCGKCGCAITAEIKKDKYIYYHCTHFSPSCDSKDYIRQEKLDELFADIVKRIEITDKTLSAIKEALLASHKDETAYHDRQILALNARYSLLKKRLDQIYIDKLDGKVSEDFYEDKAEEWQEEINKTTEMIERHKNADINYLMQGVHILELANRAYSLYLTQKPAERRKLLNTILSNCVLNDGSLCPTYKRPFDLLVKGPSSDNWLPLVDSNHGPGGYT